MGKNDNLKLVIVGHVDHGKSTLIGRLFFDTNSLPPEKLKEIMGASKQMGGETELAYLMDHLQEEREQKITIDTAQAFFKTEKRDYVIIDAPGHKEFLKNMITGASQAEAALLIVDALEGIREQTRRHAYLISMLGLKQVIVVMNKMDLVDYRQDIFETLRKDLLGFLEKVNIVPSCIIPISAKHGDNVAKKSQKMEWHDGLTILEGLDSFIANPDLSKKNPIFSIQDVYSIEGKEILVGRVESGVIHKGDRVGIWPSGVKAGISSIEFLWQNRTMAEAGENIGLTLSGSPSVKRGDVICRDDYVPTVTETVTAKVFWMDPKPLMNHEEVILKCATQETVCRIETIVERVNSSTLEIIEKNGSRLENSEVGNLIISTESPIITNNFNDVPELGRFVLERDLNTCGGGIIV